MRRLTFLGMAVFVTFPLSGTGAIGGSVFSRLLGLGPWRASLAITCGGFVGGFAFTALIVGFGTAVKDAISPAQAVMGGIAVILVLMWILNRRYRRAVAVRLATESPEWVCVAAFLVRDVTLEEAAATLPRLRLGAYLPAILHLRQALGQAKADRTMWGIAALGALGVATVLAAIPAARISDRTGRKPVIWVACALAAAGLALIAVAPTPPWAVAGVFLMGLGTGAYLAVDWALMTDTIPLITSGRYMGLANIANSIAGPVGLFIAGTFVIDRLTAAGMLEAGPRAAVALGIPAVALAAVVLIGVQPRRDPRST